MYFVIYSLRLKIWYTEQIQVVDSEVDLGLYFKVCTTLICSSEDTYKVRFEVLVREGKVVPVFN
jgi:hypothetical protein